jgi:molybdate transport system substrate-binding protein
MSAQLRIISSMATRPVLADLVLRLARESAVQVAVESVGGVDAAKRVRTGEVFDAVILAANVIDELVSEGHLLAGSRTDMMRSGVALAVREGAPRPDIGTAEAVRAAVLAARSVSLSTGPSGVALTKLFERWGIAQTIAPRLVQAPPGVPVGRLVADGRVELGFQQLSELMHLKGITVLGPLPPEIQIITTFSGGVARASAQPDSVRAMLAWLASPVTAEIKRQHGMEPA